MVTIRNSRFALIAIICLSLLLRIATSFYMGDHVQPLPGTADQVSYHTLALRVVGGHGFTFPENWWPATRAGEPTAHWSYLYTLYLAAVYWLFGPHPLIARLIQTVVVGIGHPILAYKVAELVFGIPEPTESRGTEGLKIVDRDRGTGVANAAMLDRFNVPLISAAITAVYAYFVYYSGTLMTEPFYITALLLSVYFVMRLAGASSARSRVMLGLGLGGSLAAAVLLRQVFILMIPLLLLWLFEVTRRAYDSVRPIATPVLISLTVLALAILPATVFNYVRFDRILLLNTNAGFAFYLSNHPQYGTRFIPASEMDQGYQEMIPDDLRDLDEAALDAELLKRGVGFVIDEPIRYLRLSLSRIPLYFDFLPHPQSSAVSNIARVASFGLFLPFMLVGLALPLLGRDKGNLFSKLRVPSESLYLLYSFIIGYSLVHILSWVQIRYRLPVDAVLVIFAASGVHLLLKAGLTLASRLAAVRNATPRSA